MLYVRRRTFIRLLGGAAAVALSRAARSRISRTCVVGHQRAATGHKNDYRFLRTYS
jgi:hypothetical protein